MGNSSRWARTVEVLHIYRHLIYARIRSDASYRTSFVLRIISAMFISALTYLEVAVLVSRFGTIGGWGRWPAIFLASFSSVTFRLADAVIGGPVERCGEFVRTGMFDKFLLRPIGAFVSVLTEDFAFRRVMQIFAMAPFLIVSLAHLPIDWTVGRVLFLIVMFVGAAVTYSSIFVIAACLSFWSPNTTETANAFTYGGAQVAQFPLHVLNKPIRLLAMTLVPVAFVAYLPSFVLFDAPNPLGISRLVSLLSPLSGLPLACLAATIWKFAVRHYRSTGS